MKIKLLFMVWIAISAIANAQYTKLLDFAGTNGQYPDGSFISDGTYLYGITYSGGTSTKGTGFKIKTDGSGYADLLDFSGPANGRNPNGDLMYDGTFLYGMTFYGGTNDSGVVFKIMPNGSGYSKLLDFAGMTNGKNPYSSLISDGTFLYGMTRYGGTNGMGVIFKIKPDGSGYAKLLDFAGVSNGKYPYGTLSYDGTFLYGMTAGGGASNKGTIFKIKPDGSGYSNLLNFAGASNGSNPTGSLVSDGIFFFGMTSFGGLSNKGVIFKIKPDGSGFSKLLDFAGTTNGGNPYGSLISDGTFLYGMTYGGGATGLGTIFRYQYCSAVTDSITVISPVCGSNNGSAFVTPSGGTGTYTFLWSNGNTTSSVSGLTGQPTDTLVVIITDSTGCSHIDSAFVNCVTGISQIVDPTTQLSVYPNPFSSETTIQAENLLKNATLTIYNSFGQQVKQMNNLSGKTFTLCRHDLPIGLYFISLTEESKIFSTNKLMITDK